MSFDQIAWGTAIVRDPDILESYRFDVSGLRGNPEAVARPTDLQALASCVRTALAHRIPITPVGGLTSTTGAPLATSGLALDLRGLHGVIDLEPRRDGRAIATVHPGSNLDQLKREFAAAGYLYPPDPTSTPDCTIGGTVATNANGPRSLQYGDTRRWIRGVELLDGHGDQRWYYRNRSEKIATGYRPLSQPLDCIVGSEGTLGVITRIQLELLPLPHHVLGLWVGFEAMQQLCGFMTAARRELTWPPRCLEGFDRAALALINDEPNHGAACYLEIEHDDEPRIESVLDAWLPQLEQFTDTEKIRVLQTPQQFRDNDQQRHAIPETMNSLGRGMWSNGGNKHSTDWCVPVARLEEMFAIVDRALQEADLRHLHHVRYGHFGSGHPHHNWITANTDERQRLDDVLADLYAKAVALGGTFAGEHGIGKLKAPHLSLLPPRMREVGRAIKSVFDPDWLMAPGNLFGKRTP